MEGAFKKHLFKVAELEESLNSDKAKDELTEDERWGLETYLQSWAKE